MTKNIAIFFFAGVLLFGAIAGSVYGFAKIADAADYGTEIPEVKTIELPRVEKMMPSPTPIQSIGIKPPITPSYPSTTEVMSNSIKESSRTPITDFEKDDDKEDIREEQSEEKEIHDTETSENKQVNKK